MQHLLVFIAGATIEIACVGWVHYSERDRAVKTAICSMLIASAQVAGIGEAIHGGLDAVMFVLGYGAGTFSSVAMKAWWKRKPRG